MYLLSKCRSTGRSFFEMAEHPLATACVSGFDPAVQGMIRPWNNATSGKSAFFFVHIIIIIIIYYYYSLVDDRLLHARPLLSTWCCPSILLLLKLATSPSITNLHHVQTTPQIKVARSYTTGLLTLKALISASATLRQIPTSPT